MSEDTLSAPPTFMKLRREGGASTAAGSAGLADAAGVEHWHDFPPHGEEAGLSLGFKIVLQCKKFGATVMENGVWQQVPT